MAITLQHCTVIFGRINTSVRDRVKYVPVTAKINNDIQNPRKTNF